MAGHDASPRKKNTPKMNKKAKMLDEDDFIVPDDETKKEKKGPAMTAYFKMLNRPGPSKLGTRPLPEVVPDLFENQTFVITGILECIERDDAVSIIKGCGGKVTSALSGKTAFMVVGRDPGEAKLKQAAKLPVKSITEDEFFDLFENVKKVEKSAKVTINKQEKKKMTPKKQKQEEEKIEAKIVPKKLFDRLDDGTLEKMEAQKKNKNKNNNKLWTDRYRPSDQKNIVGQNTPKSPANKLLFWLENFYEKTPKSKDNGLIYKAALLSGSPGIGKTTTAELCLTKANYEFISLNASDSRNKKTLQQTVAQTTKNHLFTAYFTKNTKRSAIIMDEVDGIAGNEDRGGLTELIDIIKKTSIPVICICNDRNSAKIRTLANYCFDLRVTKPRMEQVKALCMSVLFKEGVKMEPFTLEQIITAANCDIRLTLNKLQLLTASADREFGSVQAYNQASYKDVAQNVFESARKLLQRFECEKLSIDEKNDLFFVDYSIMPLFVQENYLKSSGSIDACRNSARSIAKSTVFDRMIRSNQSWSLLPMYGVLSCVVPSFYSSGGSLTSAVAFPEWLGKNSTSNKNKNLLDQLYTHSVVATRTDKSTFLNEYLCCFLELLHGELVLNEDCVADGTMDGVVGRMGAYYFNKQDFEDMACFAFKKYELPTKTKTALTKKVNKNNVRAPYKNDDDFGLKRKKRVKKEDEDDENYEGKAKEEESEEEEFNPFENSNSNKNNKTKRKRTVKEKK